MCYDQTKWTDAKDAILKGSIIMPIYCKEGTDYNSAQNWASDAYDFEIPDLPTIIALPNGKVVTVSEDSLTYDFVLNESQDTYCYVQFFIKCNKMVKTAGMGDTISGTGFIYHEPKPKVI